MNLSNHPLTTGTKYFYSTLPSHEQKKIYVPLYNGFIRGKKEITFDTTSFENIERIVELIKLDNPLIFYFDNYEMELYRSTASVRPHYLYTGDEIEELTERMYSKISRFTEAHKSLCTCFDKAKAIHDHLAATVTYNTSFPQFSYMPTGAILYGSAVCSGISKAFKLYADYWKLMSVVSVGKTDEIQNPGDSHAWNKVCMDDGQFYNLDVCYDLGLGGKNKNMPVRYDYFNFPDGIDRTDEFPTVKCTSSKYNYYVKNGLCFNSLPEARSYIRNNIRRTRAVQLKLSPDLKLSEKEVCSVLTANLPFLSWSASYSYNEKTNVFSMTVDTGV